ncbi:Gfo/Idh/MocA family protein [Saliphagus infecundisoli]|uniref:Gfo/Idh/MocA family protein n=1 Tax=Saliphagus infecundisoli TaxID=1849069 RepID=A0ABD5QDR2_9EURY|nr:Gfo/Idh/MocA family oxidoreductase [Saliphagus infecundisoli]
MTRVTAAVIGTGPEPDNIVWGESAAMAYRHGEAYREIEGCELVACADIVRENAEAFADEFEIDDGRVFEEFEEMLFETEPDIVSVCTPVPTHADLVVGAAETEVPGAIHCEKPMADTWEGSKRMARAAEENDVQLTFNHQRRFDPTWQEASRLVSDGVIGEVERVEMGGKNLYDFGSHLIDLCNHFVGEREAEWVLGQVHYDEEDVRYGVHNENQGLAMWSYGEGVFGLASTGYGSGADAIGAHHRILGTEGVIEVASDENEADVRYKTDTGGGWEEIDTEGAPAIERAISHAIDCLESGEEPVISADHALRATEIIFAAWASARRRGRIELPLEEGGNALTEMVETGELAPVASEDDNESGDEEE